jgi:hypothetical protein
MTEKDTMIAEPFLDLGIAELPIRYRPVEPGVLQKITSLRLVRKSLHDISLQGTTCPACG